MTCPPHTFIVDYSYWPHETLTIEEDGEIVPVMVGDVFAYCPDCGAYLSGVEIAEYLNQHYKMEEDE